MRKKRSPEQDDPTQAKRFVEIAKALQVDETGNAFARAFKKVVPRKPRGKRKK